MSFPLFQFGLRSFIGLALITSLAGRAGEAPAPPFTLSQALAAALLNSPSLQAQAFESRVAEARVLQAGIRPNPELTVGAEQFLGTGALSGVKGLETTLQLSQLIDLGGSRARRVETAEGERAVVDVESAAMRVGVLVEVARRFTEAVADTERVATARRARELGEQTVAAARVRVEAGVVSRIELNKARTALSVLQIQEKHAEHELAACRQSLAAAIGESHADFGRVEADLLTLPEIPAFEVLAARLEKSPVLARFAVEARWREAQVRLAQSLRRSGARVSGGLRRVEGTDDFGFVAGISFPLRIRDQQQGEIREARERRAQLGPALEAMRLEMRATLFSVYQEMLQARTALGQLQREVIPAAEETLAITGQGYRAGRFSLLELLDAQNSVVELHSQVVANAAAFHLHVIEIERLLGSPIQWDDSRS